LTMAVYGRAQLHNLRRAVERLPGLTTGPQLEAPALAATGTDGQLPTRSVSSLRAACARGYAGGGELRLAESGGGQDGGNANRSQPLAESGVESGCDSLTLIESAPRVGLEPTTNRLTGESTGSAKKCQTPFQTVGYSIPHLFASASDRLQEYAR